MGLLKKFFVVLASLIIPCYGYDLSACTRKQFRVAEYGNDIEAIIKLVSDVNRNNGGRILFPQNETYVLSIKNDPNGGHYLLPQDASSLFVFRNCKYVDIDMNGSEIILVENHSTKYAVFLFDNCKRFALRNGAIVGDAITHDYSPVIYNKQEENSSHEWGHGIMVMGAEGSISNINISYMCGDGIYVASRKVKGIIVGARVDISNCDISFCRRNGISSASTTGFYLADTRIHNIGSFDGVAGANPMAGIDFEYEDQLWCKGDVAIVNCTISDCERRIITTSNNFVPKVKSFVVRNCSFSGASFEPVNMVSDEGKVIVDSSFDGTSIISGKATYENCVFMMGSKLYYVHGTTFKNCLFEGTLNSLSVPYGCAIVGNNLTPAYFEACTFSNIRGLNNSSQAYQGISGFNFPLVAIFNGCSFRNVSFVKGNPKYNSSFSFLDCTLTDGCMIYNEGGAAIEFVNSTIDNVGSYMTQGGEFMFDNCDIIQDDEMVTNPLLYYGTHSIKRSRVKNTLSITPKMRSRGISEIKYKELSTK